MKIGPTATKAQVAEKDGRSRPYIHRIWNKWDWPDRVQAYAAEYPDSVSPAERRILDSAIAPRGVPMLANMSIAKGQVLHLEKISDYQSRTEKLGKTQISIASQLFEVVQHHLNDYRDKKIDRLPADVERLVRAASNAAATGSKMIGDALGVEELFITMVDHLQSAALTTVDAEQLEP